MIRRFIYTRYHYIPPSHGAGYIAGGWLQSATLRKTNGKGLTWGYNPNGQLGDNSTTSRKTPVAIVGATHNFCVITFGRYFAHAIDSAGRGWAWGEGTYGELGTNTSANVSTPIAMLSQYTFCKISNGDYHSIAIDKNGQAWQWGYWLDGNRGVPLGDVTFRSSPGQVYGTHTFCEITSYFRHSQAIDKNGQGWGWGDSLTGNAASWSSNTPVAVGGTHTFCKIATGYQNSCAIDKDGKGWGWGRYSGNNTSWDQNLTPVAICGAHTFCQITAIMFGGLAIDNNGKGWGWGYGYYGALGNGITTGYRYHKKTPVAICGAHTFCQISGRADAGWPYLSGGIALDNHGKVWAWGANIYGQVGDNTNTDRCTPVAVCDALII